jgi:iron complex transport system permease protein
VTGKLRHRSLLPLLAIALVLASILSIGVGAVQISPLQVGGILLDRLGLDSGVSYTSQQDAVLWAIRLPRVAMAVAVGAGLAASGVVLQTMLRNPLAEPGLIGLSSGASLGVILATGLGLGSLGAGNTLAAAIAAALLTGFGTVLVGRRRGARLDPTTFIIVGIAMTLLTGAVTMLLTFIFPGSGASSRESLAFGNLGTATWPDVGRTVPCVLLGIAIATLMDRELRLFQLGETHMQALGVDVERVRIVLLVATAIMVGAAVAGAGVVGFIGLIVPHAVRMLAGPGQHRLLLISAIAGGAFLVLSDLVARTLVAPVEIPVGIITALAGAPFLLLLVLRQQERRH